jgi:hypothetical protein
LLGINSNSDNPPSLVERYISKKKYEFGKELRTIEEYFTKESENEFNEL